MMESAIAGFMFELTVIIMKRSGMEQESTVVLECPAEEQMKGLQDKFQAQGFRVYVKCELLRGERM